MRISSLLISCLFLISSITHLDAATDSVSVKKFNKNFPTYVMGPDDPNTYFKDFEIPGLDFFRSSRTVYPYTFVNDYRQEKEDVEYEVVRLENKFIYIDIIPQLRGRIQGAVDKRNNWDFLYYNNVIKPAEIAVRSAWIAGGIEYNHPGGHGYTQFSKISYDILEREDGSKTVVIAEIEPVRMMKWEVEITLRPGELYFETKGRLMSTAPFPVPFVSSTNAAMHATGEMELIYPQETHASGHGFSHYRKWSEYSPDGSDWNWIKNMKTVVSVFADGRGLLEDYFGTYSHDDGIDAGSVIVADHRVAPGKKFFSWGTHPGGKQWDEFLSDEDGGYVELQQQAYFSNLGYGYAVLEPFEVKEFSIFWYPVMKTGGFVKAGREAVINFRRVDGSNLKFDIQPTINLEGSSIRILKNGEVVKEWKEDLYAGEVYNHKLAVTSTPDDTLEVSVTDRNSVEILHYKDRVDAVDRTIFRLPRKDIEEYSIDQLYSKAVANYHDPYGPDAEMYLEEIFRRDSLESRANRLKGTIFIRRGQYEEALPYLKRSLVNDHFAGGYEAHFLMGYAELKMGHIDKAHEYLSESSRYKGQLEQSLFYLAQAEIRRGDYNRALHLLQQVPVSRFTHPDFFNLMAYTWRKLGEPQLADQAIERAFRIDPLNFVGYIEKMELSQQQEELIKKINFLFDREDKLFVGSQNYIEAAIFYMDLDDYEQALRILDIAGDHYRENGDMYPFLEYYMGYCLMKTGNMKDASRMFRQASERDQSYVFPFRISSIEVLESAVQLLPENGVSRMYYGDLMYYLRRHEEAIASWEEAYRVIPDNSRLTRNLALAYYVQTRNLDTSLPMLEKSFQQSEGDRRIFAELEQMYKLAGEYSKLEQHYDNYPGILAQKWDLALNAADHYISVNRFEDAKRVIKSTYFSPAESKLGMPVRHSRYAEAHTGSGMDYLKEKNYPAAIDEFSKAYEYPEYLNEVKVNYPVTTRTDYLMGLALKMNGQRSKASSYFTKAKNQPVNTVSVATVYKAMALKETGNNAEADLMVSDLLQELGKSGQGDAIAEYIRSHCYEYLGEEEKAVQSLQTALQLDPHVRIKAIYESAFIPEEKYSME
jgi:tetratricopeptide (TPR) repeat protein